MIAVIDSGFGGMNVLCECIKLFNEDFVFLCDNKNAPYGNKSKKELFDITKQNIQFLIDKYNITAIILGCNTLSFCVYDKLKDYFNIPIYKMFFNENKINKLKKQVLFFGTKNTIKNNKFIQYKLKDKNNYKALYIKNLAYLIDNNINNLDNLIFILNKYIKNKKYDNIKSIVLCCTHFKIIKKQLNKCFKNKIEFYEYEKDVAKYLSGKIKSKENRSLKIELTNFDIKLYIRLKRYFIKNVSNI